MGLKPWESSSVSTDTKVTRFWAPTWDSVFGIVTALRVGRFEVQIPAGTNDFSSRKLPDWTWGQPNLLLNAYRMSPLPFPRGGKTAPRWGRSLAFGAELKKGWRYSFTHPICFHSVCRNNFTFTCSFSLFGTSCMYRLSFKYGFVGRSTGEGNVQLDIRVNYQLDANICLF